MTKKLLIVDDEPHIRMLIEQTLEDLEDEGVELLFACNGEEALSIILEQRPNMVFLDVMMPKMNGMEVCQRVKNDEGTDGTYIALLTAKGQEVDKQKGKDVGADIYLTKPFDPDVLLDLAREILQLDDQ